MYIDRSMQIEKKLTSLKIDSSSLNTNLVNLIQILDSENFCSQVIGDNSNVNQTINDSYEEPRYISTGIKPYQNLINTWVKA